MLGDALNLEPEAQGRLMAAAICWVHSDNSVKQLPNQSFPRPRRLRHHCKYHNFQKDYTAVEL